MYKHLETQATERLAQVILFVNNPRGTDRPHRLWTTYLLVGIIANAWFYWDKEKEEETRKGAKLKFLPHRDTSIVAIANTRAAQVRLASAADIRERHERESSEALFRQVKVTSIGQVKCVVIFKVFTLGT